MIIHHSGNIGGAGISCLNTALSLKDKYDVVVYCPSKPGDYSSFLSSKGINVKEFDFPLGAIHYYSGGAPVFSPVFIKHVYYIKKYKQRWKQIILEEKPDLLIINSKITSWFSLIAEELSIKSLCFVRETRKDSVLGVWNNIQRKYLNKFTGVVFISGFDKNKESLKKPVTQVVPNYLQISNYEQKRESHEIRKKLGIGSSSFIILFVGGMARIKGIDVLIESLKYLKHSDIKLLIAGDSNFHYRESKGILNKVYNFLKMRYERKIINNITKYSLEDKIIKVGIQKEMSDIYTVAHVLVFPANEPHQARPAFEAGVQKKAVIMPDFENTKEYVRDKYNGLIFKRRNPKSLAKSINRLINEPNLLEELGENNYKQTIIKHTKEQSELLLYGMIEEILEESNE